MGKENQPGTRVDKRFRVIRVQGPRVVDMSVAPFLLRYVRIIRAQVHLREISWVVLTDLRLLSVHTSKLLLI